MMDGQTPRDCSTIGGQVQGGRSHGMEQQQLRVQIEGPTMRAKGGGGASAATTPIATTPSS